MKVKRTEQIWLRSNKQIGELCHISKNLYNEANYALRHEFINNQKYISYYSLYPEKRISENAVQLPSQTVQQILKNLDRNWKSFFKSIKDWKKHPEKYKAMPRLPRYKNKDGEHLLIFTNQNCSIKDGVVKFPKKCNLDMEVKTRIKNEDMQQVRIIPKGYGYICEIIYWKTVTPEKLSNERVLGIDIGLKNLVTLVNNIGKQPIVVKGNIPKSINQYFNKKYAKILRQFDLQGIKKSKRFYKLINKRNRKIKDFFHKLSKFIIDYCIENDIGVIIVGHNDNWKQNVNLSKKTNQKFVQLPFNLLIQMLQYKGEETGIDIVLHDESHTSKCSFLDDETIKHHDHYVGMRTSRGLFKSSSGIIINADVNGGYNIVKKAIPNAFTKAKADRIEDAGLHPARYCLANGVFNTC